MGITIEESMKVLQEVPKVMPITKEAINVALDTMRKYQKIEQIVNSNPDYIHHTDMDTYKLNSIREVIDDGKID